MAIFSTLFLSKPEELADAFPGWRAPLPEPVRREFKLPFTGEVIIVETREPVWDDAAYERAAGGMQIVAGKGSYQEYLEDMLPEYVRDRPHWATKCLTNIELDALAAATGVTEQLDSPLYAPPSASAGLLQVPSELLAALRSFNGSDLDVIAKRWAARMSSPEHTHSVAGERIYDDWTVRQALQILEPIRALAQEATREQQMYLLIEF